MSKPTIRDVAHQAGVSVSLASLALNNKGRVSEETRQRIKAAAKELGYVPNFSARRLRGEGGTIGAIVTDTLEDAPLERFVGESLYQFNNAALKLGYKLHQIHLPSMEFSESSLFNVLSDGAIDGAIFLAPRISQIDIVLKTMERLNHLPHLFFSASPDIPSESYIDSDGYSGAAEIVRYLLSKGITKIAYLMPSDGHDHFNAHDRLAGAQAEMEKSGRRLNVYYAQHWQDTISLEIILADGNTAIIAWNDIFAMRVISKLIRMNLRIPDDIAVIGFDDELFAKWMYPKLTTVSQPLREMSSAAVDYLINRIKRETITPLQQKYPVHLIIRETA
jgi:DNA-binding LacI/PurR family transcriptional regulator